MTGYFELIFKKYSTKKIIFFGFSLNILILLIVATLGISGIYKLYNWIDSTSKIERVLNAIYRARITDKDLYQLSDSSLVVRIDSMVNTVAVLVDRSIADQYGSKSLENINTIKSMMEDFRYDFKLAKQLEKELYTSQRTLDSLFAQFYYMIPDSVTSAKAKVSSSEKLAFSKGKGELLGALLQLRQSQSLLGFGNFTLVSKDNIRGNISRIQSVLDNLRVDENDSSSMPKILKARRVIRGIEEHLYTVLETTIDSHYAYQRLSQTSVTIQNAGEKALYFQKMELKGWGFFNIVFLVVVIVFAALSGIFLIVFFAYLIRNYDEYKSASQKSLYEKQKFLDDIIHNSSSLVTVKDLKGKYIVVNSSWQETFSLSRDEVIGQIDPDLFPEERKKLFSDFEQRVIFQGIAQQVEETFIVKGKRLIYLSNIFPIINELGQITAVCTISLNLTSLRDMQRALERSEREYKTIVANVPGIVFHCKTDPHRKMLFISDGVKVLTGVSPHDFLSESVQFGDMITSEDFALVRNELERAVRSRRPYEIEYRIKDVRGRVRWVYERGTSMMSPELNEVTLQGVIVDITEQKNSLESINSRDKFLAGVADAVKELIVNPVVDEAIKRAMRIIGESANVERSFVFRNGVDEYGNFVTSQLFAWHKGKISPTFRSDMQNLNFEDFVPRWYHILSEKREILGLITEFPEAEQRIIAQFEVGSIIMVPVFTRELFWGFIGFGVFDKFKVWTDAERAIFKAFSVTLGIAIAKSEDAAALQEAKETAEAATKTKSDFLARMSHEIRTPMNAIIGWTHLAMEKEVNAIQSDYLRKIQSSSKALLGIINDILDFSKIEADKLTIEYIDFDLEDVMNDLSSMVSYKGQEKKLEMVFSISPDVPLSLIGDPLRLTQVLVNLVNNAVKFTAKGEVVVNVKVEDDAEGVIILRFDVRDTGIGLTEEQLVNLFDSFSQADVSTTRKYGGTGLGLAICKRLTALMGGDIWVDSEYGVGSAFSFTASFGLQAVQKKNRAVLSHSVQGLNVLICDKNASSVTALVQMLRAFKCNPIITYTSKGALHELSPSKANKPNIIFIDWKVENIEDVILTERDGKTVVIDIPIVAMLGNYNQGESVKNVKTLGIGGVLYKPFNYSAVLDVMMDALGLSSGNRLVRRNESGHYLKSLKMKKGLRVLLVEDNETNQQIGIELIMMAGVKVDVASNGQEAIQMVQNSGYPSKYTLVFMDIQMPVMDGYKATSEIRKLPVYESIPIIAMTADAIGGALERYLEIGMDGMVAKPIDPEEMYKVILEFSERNGDHGKMAGVNENATTIDIKLTHAENTLSSNLPEIEGINVAECLNRLVGRLDFFQRLLTRFYYDHLTFEERFLAASQANDEELALRMLHSFKGIVGTISAVEIYPLSIEVEEAYKSKDSSFNMKFTHMMGLLNRLLQELANNKFITLQTNAKSNNEDDIDSE